MATSIPLSVRSYGAVGNGIADDTAAFERAIAAAAAAATTSARTEILVPGPASYLIRPVNLTSNLDLHLQAGARILGVADAAAWPVIAPAPSYGQGRDHVGPRYTSLLHGEHLHNVTIRGDGPSSVINGQGHYWWRRVNVHTRGHLIELMYSTSVEIADLALLDSPFWNVHLYDCDRVHVHGLRIVAPDDSPNTDGVDPDSSTNVLIEDVDYRAGDDCVAIKSGWDCFGEAYARPAANITVRNLTCEGRYAGIALGSEMSGGIENVTVEDVRFVRRANGAAHIKAHQSRGGYVTNVRFSRLTFADGTELSEGVLVDAHYGDPNPSCPAGWRPAAPPRIANLTLEHIDGHAAHIVYSPFHFRGSAGASIEGVTLRDVHFRPAAWWWRLWSSNWECGYVHGEAERSVTPWPPCDGIRPGGQSEWPRWPLLVVVVSVAVGVAIWRSRWRRSSSCHRGSAPRGPRAQEGCSSSRGRTSATAPGGAGGWHEMAEEA